MSQVKPGSLESPPVEYVGRGGIEGAMRAAADAAAAKYKKPAQLLLVVFPTKARSKGEEKPRPRPQASRVVSSDA